MLFWIILGSFGLFCLLLLIILFAVSCFYNVKITLGKDR